MAGAAWGASFSHRLHLEMGLTCTGCHAAAPASTKPADNLLPARSVCLDCHESAAIPPPPATNLTAFSHALHLKMGNVAPFIAAAIDHGAYLSAPGDGRRLLNTNNACEACHRGLHESDSVSPALLPRMADCLVCHADIDPPWSCELCHGKDAKLRPANHTAHFVSDHSSGKMKFDKTTCAVCHGRTFQCAGCH